MIRRQFPRFLSSMIAIVGICLVLTAPARAAERDQVEAFLATTGFDVALESIKLSAENAPMMLGREVSEFGTQWTRMADEVFDTAAMHDTAVGILTQTLDQDDLMHAVEFYASDLGQRLVEVENASHMEQDREAKLETGQALFAGLDAEGSPKVALFERMGAAISSEDSAVRAVEEIQVRFLLAAAAVGVIPPLDERALREVMADGRDDLRQELRTNSLAGAAYTYRDFQYDDLLAYTQALEHPRMRRVYELLNAVQHEIMANRFELLAQRMADIAPQEEL